MHYKAVSYLYENIIVLDYNFLFFIISTSSAPCLFYYKIHNFNKDNVLQQEMRDSAEVVVDVGLQ